MPEIRDIDDKVTQIRFPEREPIVAVAATVVYQDELVILTRVATFVGDDVSYDHRLFEFEP